MTATPKPARKTVPLGAEVRRLMDAVYKEAQRSGRDDLAEQIVTEHRRPVSRLPQVVVAGETKRGKSQLVNALLGRPNLSPVGPRVLTSAHLIFGYSKQPFARVQLKPDEASDHIVTETIDLEDIPAYATVDGNPDNEKRVNAIIVGLDAPVVERMLLIDTPGIGGLERGHAELTLVALARAQALIFVADASAPLSGPELKFLERAGARIDQIVIVLTKIDLFPDWRTLIEDDRRLLSERGEHLAQISILPVSSRYGEEADAMPQHRDELRASSGIGLLSTVLRERVAARAGVLDLANKLRVCLSVLPELQQMAREAPVNVASDPELRAELEAERDHLKDFTDRAVAWPTEVNVAFNAARNDLQAQLDRDLDKLQEDYLEAIDGRDPELRETLPMMLEADLGAIVARQSERLLERAATIESEVFGELSGHSLREALAQSRLEWGGLSSTEPKARKASARNQTKSMLTNVVRYAAIGASPVLFMGPAAAPVAVVSGVVGVGATFLGFGQGTKESRRADIERWSTQQVGLARRDVGRDSAARLVAAQAMFMKAAGQLQQRRGELENALKAHTHQLQVNEAEFAQLKKTSDERIAALAKLTTYAEKLARLAASA